MHFDSFDDVTQWLDSFTPPSTSSPGLIREARLDRMRLLLAALGNPEDGFKAIHVAGSKGKGSTCRFISAMLAASGERTGLYLSPHLVDYRERFTLDGAFFFDKDLIEVACRLADVVEGFNLDPSYGFKKPTTFELYTAYAYMLFRHAGCTWAVVETGLGGRLDATNTLEDVCSVITPIELEHTAVLGDTIEKIAVEKSKIIKKDSIAVTGLLRDEAFDVMRREAARQGSRLVSLAHEIRSLETRTTLDGEVCNIAFRDGSSHSLRLSMPGEVQAQNAALALLVAKTLGFYIHGTSEPALEKATLPGRFEIHVIDGVPVVIDVCHTRVSMIHTVSSFKALFSDARRTTCIFAAIEGKDITHMLQTVLASFNRVIIGRPSSVKRSDSEAIWRQAIAMGADGVEILHIPDARQALDEALRTSDAVLVAGSFYLATLFEEIARC